MNKKIRYYINISFYFKIHDSHMFGGEGSVGYAAAAFNHCTAFSEEKVREAYKSLADSLAEQFNVDVSKIECIAKEEYDSSDEEDE